jgi:hypothetical protein
MKADSRDAVWRVTLTERSDFNAVARPVTLDAGTDAVLYLRSSPCVGGAELACIDNESELPEQLRVRGLDAGTYFLIVEGYGTTGSGAVELTTWATPPVPLPPNDTCAAPRVLDFSATNSLRFTVDTSDAEDDAIGTCAFGPGGRDTVYAFNLASGRTVTVTSESADGGVSVDPMIYLRAGGCGSDAGTEINCADDYPAPEVMVNTLPAGQYYLFVDSFSSSTAGPTVVTVTLSP